MTDLSSIIFRNRIFLNTLLHDFSILLNRVLAIMNIRFGGQSFMTRI